MGSFFGGVQPPSVSLSDLVPSTEGISGAAGAMSLASRGDHAHQRLTSATVVSLNASGEATVTFTRTFSVMPAMACLLVESADNQPVIFKVKTWTQDGSLNYTGCVIKGYRAQVLPQNLATLLLSAVFNLFAGSASGAQCCVIALQPSA